MTYRGFPPPKDPVGVPHGHLYKRHFFSTALNHRRYYLVYTPPGYTRAAARGVRFPVLYLLHGSPGGPHQFINVSRAGVALDVGLRKRQLRPFLLVMPAGSDGTFRSDTEWANTPHGNYESYVLETVHQVDRHFSTIRNARFRAIGGNSEGGYAAVNITLHHPSVFSIAEAWSGYFWQNRRGPFKLATPTQYFNNDPSLYVSTLGPKLKHRKVHVFIYKGSREPKSVRQHAALFSQQLRLVGGDVTFRVYKGGHDWLLWRNQTPHMLRYASRWFGARR